MDIEELLKLNTPDKFVALGIPYARISLNNMYENLLGSMSAPDAFSFAMICNGGQERSPRMGKIAQEMGYSVARIKPNFFKSYHKPMGIPVNELFEVAKDVIYEDGRLHFNLLDRGINIMTVFSYGRHDAPDRYVSQMMSGVALGLFTAASEQGISSMPGIAVFEVMALEQDIAPMERLWLADKTEPQIVNILSKNQGS